MGPFEVLKVDKVSHRIDLPLSMKAHPIFYVALLLRDKPRPHHMRAEKIWGSVDRKNQDEWEVKYLLDRRGSGFNKEFLVKWKGLFLKRNDLGAVG